ncbi:MAG: RNA polymerase sigma factor [Actinomycetota bacterium]
MAIGSGFGDILDSARRGDERSLEVLYRDLAPAVLGYMRGQRAAEPDDLTSEVFLAVARGLGRFRGDEAAFRSFVFTIAHRRLIDERRRLHRSKEFPVDAATLAETHTPGTAGDAEQEALDRLGRRWVDEALATLTDEQRAVILLRVVADLPVLEVARILGKPEGAIKALQRRGLRFLARTIEPEGVS